MLEVIPNSCDPERLFSVFKRHCAPSRAMEHGFGEKGWPGTDKVQHVVRATRGVHRVADLGVLQDFYGSGPIKHHQRGSTHNPLLNPLEPATFNPHQRGLFTLVRGGEKNTKVETLDPI